MYSNCCAAPILQPCLITGHGHCKECGDTCTPIEEDMKQEKEKRTERKTLPLTPSEFVAFTAAANAKQPAQPLTAWIVEACWEKLARESAGPELRIGKFANLNKQR